MTSYVLGKSNTMLEIVNTFFIILHFFSFPFMIKRLEFNERRFHG